MDKIYGRKPVLDSLDSGIKIHEAYIMDQKSKIIFEIIEKLKKRNIKINYVDKKFFDDVKINHQGVMITAESFKYSDIDEVINKNRVIILDKIEDPHNLGAIIRSSESFGFDAVIIPENRSAGVNSTVYKTSAGAINNMKVVKVTNLTRTIDLLKENGFWIYGLDGDAPDIISNADLKGKVAIVVGNEGSGISRLVRENCDILVKIPMIGKINSLNASVAAAISMYEVLRQNAFN